MCASRHLTRIYSLYKIFNVSAKSLVDVVITIQSHFSTGAIYATARSLCSFE